jgi:hypothetical protein
MFAASLLLASSLIFLGAGARATAQTETEVSIANHRGDNGSNTTLYAYLYAEPGNVPLDSSTAGNLEIVFQMCPTAGGAGGCRLACEAYLSNATAACQFHYSALPPGQYIIKSIFGGTSEYLPSENQYTVVIGDGGVGW